MERSCCPRPGRLADASSARSPCFTKRSRHRYPASAIRASSVSDFVLPAQQNGGAILEGIIRCWDFTGFSVCHRSSFSFLWVETLCPLRSAPFRSPLPHPTLSHLPTRSLRPHLAPPVRRSYSQWKVRSWMARSFSPRAGGFECGLKHRTMVPSPTAFAPVTFTGVRRGRGGSIRGNPVSLCYLCALM